MPVDGQDAVTDLHAGQLGRTARDELADFSRHRGVPELEAQAGHQRARLGERATVAGDLERQAAAAAGSFVRLHLECDRGVVHQAVEDGEHRAFARRDGLPAYAHDRVARQQPGAGRNGVGRHVADDRLQGRRTHHEQDPVRDRRKQEVGEGPRQQHQDPTPDGLAVVGLAHQCGVDWTFALVEEFYVTP